jgi:hypothetical protein
MSDYPVGTVAVGKVLGRDARLLRSMHGWHFVPTDAVHPSGFADDGRDHPEVADVRPLVVLDLDPNAHVGPDVLVRKLRRDGYCDLADQIEAQTEPPRIPEPGRWGVVRGWDGQVYVRTSAVHVKHGWRCVTGGGGPIAWDDIDEPTLVRPGIEEES